MNKLYFIGIVFENKISNKIKALKVLAKTEFGCCWALRSPAHITLVPPFHYDDKDVLLIKELLEGLDTSQLRLRLNGVGTFHKRVIFIKIEHQAFLFQLKDKLDHLLQPYGIKVKSDHFHPHATIAFKDLKPELFDDARLYFADKSRIGTSKDCRLVLFVNDKKGWKALV